MWPDPRPVTLRPVRRTGGDPAAVDRVAVRQVAGDGLEVAPAGDLRRGEPTPAVGLTAGGHVRECVQPPVVAGRAHLGILEAGPLALADEPAGAGAKEPLHVALFDVAGGV